MMDFASTQEKALLAQKPKKVNSGGKALVKPLKTIPEISPETKKIYNSIYTLYVLHDWSRKEIARQLNVSVVMIGQAIRYVISQYDTITDKEIRELTIDRIRFRKKALLKQMKNITNETGLWLKFQKELIKLDQYESRIDGSLKGDIQVDNRKVVVLQNIRQDKTIEIEN
jgi:predicted DNA-binding protein YlxM (UPF0122 family)